MDKVTDLENHKNQVYKFYGITNQDIETLFHNTYTRHGNLLSTHLISKFTGYNNNPILFIDSLDCNIKKYLLDDYKLNSDFYHKFFAWYNNYYNIGKCFDDYCHYKVALDDYYCKTSSEKKKIIEKFMLRTPFM